MTSIVPQSSLGRSNAIRKQQASTAFVTKVIAESAGAGIKAAVIIQAAFKEFGPAGTDLEKQILKCREIWRRSRPNRPTTGTEVTLRTI